uniref:Uncharacterized protein n=1 Tax=Grammatophora oceanica TaxID=210454 RepID=A0A7S1YB37_9STRA|mmetsp:Transcript_36917/g.54978  ORF Transcript_36917/g.54978 Transcript_36917/m.54978 type:complete len:163 (+) Transcript_36917:114-602(+)
MFVFSGARLLLFWPDTEICFCWSFGQFRVSCGGPIVLLLTFFNEEGETTFLAAAGEYQGWMEILTNLRSETSEQQQQHLLIFKTSLVSPALSFVAIFIQCSYSLARGYCCFGQTPKYASAGPSDSFELVAGAQLSYYLLSSTRKAKQLFWPLLENTKVGWKS